MFGERLPRALSPAFKDAALAVSDGVPGLHTALCGLFAAREAILTAVGAIDVDIKKMTRRSEVCQRLMTVPPSRACKHALPGSGGWPDHCIGLCRSN